MAPRSDEWKIDLHLHSTFSPDGEMTPAELVRTAVEKGLQGVALTDHNSISGVSQPFGEAGGFTCSAQEKNHTL